MTHHTQGTSTLEESHIEAPTHPPGPDRLHFLGLAGAGMYTCAGNGSLRRSLPPGSMLSPRPLPLTLAVEQWDEGLARVC